MVPIKHKDMKAHFQQHHQNYVNYPEYHWVEEISNMDTIGFCRRSSRIHLEIFVLAQAIENTHSRWLCPQHKRNISCMFARVVYSYSQVEKGILQYLVYVPVMKWHRNGENERQTLRAWSRTICIPTSTLYMLLISHSGCFNISIFQFSLHDRND